jgi:hypothetical protein
LYTLGVDEWHQSECTGNEKPSPAEIPDDGRFIAKPHKAEELFAQVEDLMQKHCYDGETPPAGEGIVYSRYKADGQGGSSKAKRYRTWVNQPPIFERHRHDQQY